MQAEHIYPFGEKKFLLGLHWLPVVGQVAPQQARLLAKQHKAKQWVIAGQTFFAVGLVHRQSTVKKNVYAAAACHALLYPKGRHVTIYKLHDDLYWLAATHEGTPMSRGDTVFTELGQAQAALSQLLAQQSALSSASEPIAIGDFLALISTHSLHQACLQSLRVTVWRPVSVVLLLLGMWGWWQFEAEPLEAAVIAPEVDPYLLHWEHSKAQLNGKEALMQLLLSFREIPLVMKGWQLQEVVCETTTQQWLCEYEYKVTADAATTLELEQVLPEGWKNKEVNLQRAWFQQAINFTSQPTAWLNAEQIRLQLLSQLQSIRPAFSSLRLADPILLLPRLAGASTYSPIFSQELYFEGPLRSLVLLTDFDEALQWQRVVLHYRPQVEASLKSSALQVKLQGVVYVRD